MPHCSRRSVVRPNVATATKAMCDYQGCVFPQCPYHGALGACDKDVAKGVIRQVSRRLMGAILSTADSGMFSVLLPPVDDKLFLDNNNKSSEHAELTIKSHNERVQKNLKNYPAISAAMETANTLNASLAVFTKS